MDESKPDDRLEAFEKRQQLFISQRLEYHSNATNRKIEGVRVELKEDIAGVRDELKEDIAGVRVELKEDIAGVRKASESAHESILERLKRIESKLE